MESFEDLGAVLSALAISTTTIKERRKLCASSRSRRDNIAESCLATYYLPLTVHQDEIEMTVLNLGKNAGIKGLTKGNLRERQCWSRWRKHELKLESFLGTEKYPEYKAIVRSIQQVCQAVILLLKDLFPRQISILDTSVGFLDAFVRMSQCASSSTYLRPTNSFVSRHGQVEEKLIELGRAVDRLGQITKTPVDKVHETAAMATRTRPSMKAFNATERLRKATDHLLVALGRTLPSTCKLHTKHSLRLFLESHTARERFTFCEQQHPSFLLEVLHKAANSKLNTVLRDRIYVRQSTEESLPPEKDQPTKRPRVRIQEPLLTPDPSLPHSDQDKTGLPSANVGSLCDAFRAANPYSLALHVSHAGVLQSRTATERQDNLNTRDTISLAQILKKTEANRSEELAWGRQQRLRLAYVLASTLLQLNYASWLPCEFRADTILFHVRSERMRNETFFDPTSPFLEDSCISSKRCAPPRKVEEWVLELGVILLQLWQGERLEHWASRRDKDCSQGNEDRRGLALEWFSELETEMLDPYPGAVRGCFEIASMVHDKWDTENVRKQFFRRVVAPLEEYSKPGWTDDDFDEA